MKIVLIALAVANVASQCENGWIEEDVLKKAAEIVSHNTCIPARGLSQNSDSKAFVRPIQELSAAGINIACYAKDQGDNHPHSSAIPMPIFVCKSNLVDCFNNIPTGLPQRGPVIALSEGCDLATMNLGKQPFKIKTLEIKTWPCSQIQDLEVVTIHGDPRNGHEFGAWSSNLPRATGSDSRQLPVDIDQSLDELAQQPKAAELLIQMTPWESNQKSNVIGWMITKLSICRPRILEGDAR